MKETRPMAKHHRPMTRSAELRHGVNHSHHDHISYFMTLVSGPVRDQTCTSRSVVRCPILYQLSQLGRGWLKWLLHIFLLTLVIENIIYLRFVIKLSICLLDYVVSKFFESASINLDFGFNIQRIYQNIHTSLKG